MGPKKTTGEEMKSALVTGGGGFVGKAVVHSLLNKGVSTTVVGRNHYPELADVGVLCCRGDIRDPDFLNSCCKNVDTVFHVAALAGIWGKWSDYYSINVLGTQNVINACRKNNIERLVYTSTPSVVFDSDNICEGNETLPYPTSFRCHYAKSKVLAERMILEAADSSLRTCAIRPHLIWGPHDPHLIPRIIDRGRKRQLKIIGTGKNLVDISYIDNVVHAHILAAENLAGNGSASGEAYFISQGEPVNLWDWINSLFADVGVEEISRKVPFGIAFSVGTLLEIVHTIFKPDEEPRMTRFLAEQLAKSHYFSIEKARTDLGYEPLISTQQGMEKLLAWLHTNENETA